MLVAGEVKNFRYYFGANKDTIYCLLEVKHTNAQLYSHKGVVFEKVDLKKFGKNLEKNAISLKLTVTEETLNLLLQQTCYFEIDDKVERVFDYPHYKVKSQFSPKAFFAIFEPVTESTLIESQVFIFDQKTTKIINKI